MADGARGAQRLLLQGARPHRNPRRGLRRPDLGGLLRLKRVYTAANLPEAHILADWLADRGIRARIFNANASSIAGELPLEAALPQLWVENDADSERARELIHEFHRASIHGPPLTCHACGEESPSSFDLCWACGAGLMGSDSN